MRGIVPRTDFVLSGEQILSDGVDFRGVGIGPRGFEQEQGDRGFVDMVRRIPVAGILSRRDLTDDSLDRGLHDGSVDRLAGLDESIGRQHADRSVDRLHLEDGPAPGDRLVDGGLIRSRCAQRQSRQESGEEPDVAAGQHGDFLRSIDSGTVRAFR